MTYDLCHMLGHKKSPSSHWAETFKKRGQFHVDIRHVPEIYLSLLMDSECQVTRYNLKKWILINRTFHLIYYQIQLKSK